MAESTRSKLRSASNHSNHVAARCQKERDGLRARPCPPPCGYEVLKTSKVDEGQSTETRACRMMAVKGGRLNDPESTESQAGVTWRAHLRVSERVCMRVCVYAYSVVGSE